MKYKTSRYLPWAARLLLAAMALTALLALPAAAASPQRQVLRVAFPQVEGISETDEYGNRTGMVVDYLNEIAKYTNWEYEYIESTPEDVVGEFLEGRFDLMGGTFYSPGFEEYFGYPDYTTGRSQAALLCRKQDSSILSYDLKSLNGKTIGVYASATEKIRYLEEFLAANDLNCTLRSYTYQELGNSSILYPLLRSGEVDLIMGNELEVGGEFRMATSFPAQPYCIVTIPGNTEVLEGLNMALRYIQEATPGFAEESYNTNFPDAKSTDIQLNEKELTYVAQNPTVTVALPGEWHPFYCITDTDTHHEGILPEMLAEVTAFTGLQFEYLLTDTYAQSIEAVLNGEADVLGGYIGDETQAFADGFALSQAYSELNSIIIKHKSVSFPDEGLRCGVLEGSTLPKRFEAESVWYYSTIHELVEAVNKNEVDYVYGVSSMLEPELQNHRYANLVPVNQMSEDTGVAFALARPVTPELLTILNKAVSDIPSEEKSAMLKRNLLSVGYSSMSLQDMVYANPVAFIAIFGFVLLLGVSVVLLILRSRFNSAVLQSQVQAAEARSTAKSEFLSRMSHEIRTPMNAIVGLTDLIIREESVPAKVTAQLQKIRGSSRYMLSLINDILDMSRIENGRMELESQTFLLSDILREMQQMMQVQAEQKNLCFEANIRIGYDCLVGDPLRLRQVLTNLLSNAIKFTPAGGTVTLTAEQTESSDGKVSYYFSVMDTGVGIPPEDQQRIFDAFEQVDHSISRSAGTGLGLPISRSIVRLMGGDLQVKSEPGQGSEFYMTLRFPLGENRPAAASSTSAQPSLQGMQVLLAEDNDLNAEIAIQLLATQGVQVTRAVNGKQAVELFTSSEPGHFSAVLMDVRMPEMDGYAATRAIRASAHPDAALPIIAMTANSFKEDEDAARAAGMTGFLPKPVDTERLFKELRAVL